MYFAVLEFIVYSNDNKYNENLGAIYVDWRRFSNTCISSFAYMRGPLKIQVNWHKKSIVAENTLENTKMNMFEIQY